MSQARVSAIITTYNRADIVHKAVQSALNCCQDGDEIIVVDDCSTDHTQQSLEQFGDKIKYIRLDQNSGPSVARNTGIDASQNSLIAFLDDDDEWIPENLMLRKIIMQAYPEVIYSFSNFSTKYSNGEIARNFLFNWGHEITDWDKIIGKGVKYSSIASLPEDIDDFYVYVGSIYRSQMNDDHVLPSSMVVNRDLAGEQIYFDINMRLQESWQYSCKLARISPVAYLDVSTTWQNEYQVPRLTDTTSLKRYNAQIHVLENQWGKDLEFLKDYSQEYYYRLDKERKRRIKEYLALGFSKEAKEDIARIQTAVPTSFKILANMPPRLLQALMSLRMKLKGLR